MGYNEQEAMRTIAELKKEIAEDEELIEGAFEKIQDLTLRLSLRDSAFTKDNQSKQIEAYETKISELEELAELVAVEELQDRKNEVSTYLKKVLQLKSRLTELEQHKRVRHSEIDELYLDIANLAEKISTEFTRMMLLYNKLKNFNNEELDRSDIDELFQLIGCIPFILHTKNTVISNLNCEVNRLQNAIEEYAGTTKSLTELQSELEAKDKAIESYKKKIAGLEFDIQRQNSNKAN